MRVLHILCIAYFIALALQGGLKSEVRPTLEVGLHLAPCPAEAHTDAPFYPHNIAVISGEFQYVQSLLQYSTESQQDIYAPMT